MEAVHARVRNWGRSLGVVIPKEAAKKVGIKEGDSVEILIKKEEENPLKKTFGALKGREIDTDKLLKEVDEELWND